MNTKVERESLKTGDEVWKHGAGYSGPGEVVVAFNGKDGHRRFVVSHQIAGGDGEFFHIYGEGQLTLVPPKEAHDEESAGS